MHDLQLHHSMNYNTHEVIRVPGGWIYRFWNIAKQESENAVFVPYNTEFDPSIPEPTDSPLQKKMFDDIPEREFEDKEF